MKAQDIITQLKVLIPKYTDLFSEKITVSSLTYSAGTVTCTTSKAHGLKTGDYVNITGAYSRTPISSITRVDTVATATTTITHDLTEDYHETVYISGASQSDYNGSKTLLSVPTNKTFTFTVENSPTTPATGTIYLYEDIIDQFNGRHEITSTGANTFTYTISGTPQATAGGTIYVKKDVRISGTATVEKMLDSYTKMDTDKLWAFVILGDTVASKDKSTIGDEVFSQTAGVDVRQKLIQNFSIYTIQSSKDSISGRAERDDAEDLRVYLIKCLVGAYFDSGFDEADNYGVAYLGDSFELYNNAFYIHKFDFQTTTVINQNDIFNDTDNKALRSFVINYEREDDNYVVKEDAGDLP